MTAEAINSLSDWLMSDNFIIEYMVYGTADALRNALHRSSEVAQLRSYLERGEITPKEVEDLVSEMIRQFKPGEKYVYDVSLAAVVVGIENDRREITSRLICDLSMLRCPEMPMSIRVARIALRSRRGKTGNLYSSFVDPQIGFEQFAQYEQYQLPMSDSAFRTRNEQREFFTPMAG